MIHIKKNLQLAQKEVGDFVFIHLWTRASDDELHRMAPPEH